MEKFRENLGHLNWNNVKESNDVDVAYKNFWSTFKSLYDLNFPPTKKKFNKNYHKINGYMTQGLLISRRTKIDLLKKSVNEPSESNIQNYRNFRNIYTKKQRASCKLYFEANFLKAKKSPKKTWDLIREAIGSDTSKSKIEKLTIANRSIDNPASRPNELNKFFVSAGKNIANSICKTSTEPESFLKTNSAPILEFSLTSPGEIVDIIRGFQSKTSFDIDGMSIKFLKSVAIEISFPLTHIFNLSLKNGTFPSAFKLSRVVPIHKGGKADICDNYRPIALLSSISKILEKIVSLKLVNHLEINKLISPKQFGFQRNKNTKQNLLNVVNFISNAINEGQFCIGIFLDLRKAFDVCDHEILFKKTKK